MVGVRLPVASRIRREPLPAVILLPAGGAVALLLFLTQSGLALTSDSVQYLAAGRSLASGGPPVTVSGEPFVLWPPLLPFAIAALSAITPALDLLRFLNVAVYGALGALAAGHLYRATGRVLPAFFGAALLVAHPWIGYVHAHLWSEPLFLLWTLLALTSVHSLWRLAIFTALAILTRYVGLSLVPVGLAVLLLDGRYPPRVRGRRALTFAAVSLTPLMLWALHNWLVTGAVLPPRPPSAQALQGAAGSLATGLVQAMLPWRVASALAPLVWLPVLVLAWGAALAAALRLPRPTAAAALLWIGTYVALLLFMAGRVPMDPIGPRLLAPIVLGLSVSLPLIARPFPGTLLAAGILAVGVLHEGRLWASVRYDPPDSLRAFARRSMPAPDATYLVSNLPEAVYLMTGRSATISPRHSPYGSRKDVSAAELARLGRTAARASTALIWFNARRSPRLLPLDRIAGTLRLQRVRQTPDLAMFAVGPPQPVVAGKGPAPRRSADGTSDRVP